MKVALKEIKIFNLIFKYYTVNHQVTKRYHLTWIAMFSHVAEYISISGDKYTQKLNTITLSRQVAR